MIYVKLIDIVVWKVIKESYTGLPKLEGILRLQNQKMNGMKMTTKKEGFHAKTMNAILCAIILGEFNKISKCTITKAMWDKLEVTYECTNQVKETKIRMLVHRYEIFKMEEGERVEQMFERLFVIVNGLHALRRIIF